MSTNQSAKLAGWASRWLTSELQALASAGSWEAAIQTFTQMSGMTREEPVPGTAPQPITSQLSPAAASVFGASDGATSASSSSSSASTITSGTNAVLERQQHQARVYHYTTIISACGKAGQWEAALQAFTHMHHARVAPNIRTYCSVLHSCTRGEKLDLALRAWAMMESDGVVANVFATTAMVSAFSRAGRWDDAIRMTIDAETSPFPNQEPNIFTYTAAMDGCRRAARADMAVALLTRMRERGLRANTVSVATALHACAVARDWQCALRALDHMKADGVMLVPFARTCALDAIADAPVAVAQAGLDAWVGGARERRPFVPGSARAGLGGGAGASSSSSSSGGGGSAVDGENGFASSRSYHGSVLPSDIMDLLQDPRPPNQPPVSTK